MFESIIRDGSVSTSGFFLCLGTALAAGCLFAFLSGLYEKSSKSFFTATALLPMAVATVILLINGNLGVGVAIAGAFGLVRFRSAAGTAREIAVIFIAMASGLAFGTGYLAYGAIFLLLSGALLLLFAKLPIGENTAVLERRVKITIPEALDYTAVFDDIFDACTTEYEQEQIKSVNMGSMFRLTYRVTLKEKGAEKPMLDALRTRNGNLEIVCSRTDVSCRDL